MVIVLLKDTTRRSWVSNPGPLDPESDALPLSHRALLWLWCSLESLQIIFVTHLICSSVINNDKSFICISESERKIIAGVQLRGFMCNFADFKGLTISKALYVTKIYLYK